MPDAAETFRALFPALYRLQSAAAELEVVLSAAAGVDHHGEPTDRTEVSEHELRDHVSRIDEVLSEPGVDLVVAMEPYWLQPLMAARTACLDWPGGDAYGGPCV